MRKWMDKGAAKAEGGTPAPRGVAWIQCKFVMVFALPILQATPRSLVALWHLNTTMIIIF